jgi:hypothetical protein
MEIEGVLDRQDDRLGLGLVHGLAASLLQPGT